MIEHSSKAQDRAVKLMVKGPYRKHFWLSYVLCGTLIPAVLIATQNMQVIHTCEILYPICSVLALIGLFAYEHSFVMAGQAVRLS